jgi:hypothetical protein
LKTEEGSVVKGEYREHGRVNAIEQRRKGPLNPRDLGVRVSDYSK